MNGESNREIAKAVNNLPFTLLRAAGEQEDRIIGSHHASVRLLGRFPAGRLLLPAGLEQGSLILY
jgi:hypothetical protein